MTTPTTTTTPQRSGWINLHVPRQEDVYRAASKARHTAWCAAHKETSPRALPLFHFESKLPVATTALLTVLQRAWQGAVPEGEYELDSSVVTSDAEYESDTEQYAWLGAAPDERGWGPFAAPAEEMFPLRAHVYDDMSKPGLSNEVEKEFVCTGAWHAFMDEIYVGMNEGCRWAPREAIQCVITTKSGKVYCRGAFYDGTLVWQ